MRVEWILGTRRSPHPTSRGFQPLMASALENVLCKAVVQYLTNCTNLCLN